MSAPRRSIPLIPALDGFRAYAIAGVVLVHLLGASGVIAATEGTLTNTAIWGLLGNVIDAFFILSGFLLFMPVVIRGGLGGLRRFARGRAARLLPAYWLCLLTAIALLAVVPPLPGLGVPSALDVGVHATALQMPARLIDPALAVGFGIDGPLWMISVIVGFYLVLPVIARPYLRHPLIGLGLAAAVTVGWKELALRTDLFVALAGGDAPAWATQLIAIDQLPGWAFSFALGMTGAWAYVRARERWPSELLCRRALQALPAALAFYLLLAYLYGKIGETISGVVTGAVARSDSLTALGSSVSRALLMAVVVLGPLWLQRPFANRLAGRGAELSYGAYLIHLIVIVYVARYLGLPDDGGLAAIAAWCGVVVPASLLYAYGSNRLVERPARDWARRREHRGYDPASPAPGTFEPIASTPAPGGR